MPFLFLLYVVAFTDRNARRLIVHRDPAGSVYKSVIAYAEQERVASAAAPGTEINVAALLRA